MNTIKVSTKNLKIDSLNRKVRDQAVQAIRTDGYVVLHHVIDPALIQVLQPKMLEDAPKIAALKNPPYQFVKGHIQHDPPPLKPYLFREMLCNDLIISVAHAVLGQKIKNTAYTGNTNLPGSVRQPVHADQCHLGYHQDQAHPPGALVVNVPIVDMTVHTGSIELWPGSHQDTTIGPDDKIRYWWYPLGRGHLDQFFRPCKVRSTIFTQWQVEERTTGLRRMDPNGIGPR